MEQLYDKLKSIQRGTIEETVRLGKLSDDKIKYIISKIDDIENLDDGKCWIWIGRSGDTNKGHQHGLIWFNDNWRMVHRLMYHNFVGHVPEFERKKDALQVNHLCSHENNGRCINPTHLRLGTPRENMQDALREGTKNKAASGQENPNATLTDDQVKEIINLKGSGESQKSIAARYGVHQSQVSRWWNNVTRK